MKNIKITAPFILKRKDQEKTVDPNDTVAALVQKQELSKKRNRELYERFSGHLGTPIYTEPRYEDNFKSVKDLHFERNLQQNLAQQRLSLQHEILEITSNARMKVQFKGKDNRIAESSFHGKLPPKLDLDIIKNFETNYQEYSELSKLDESILGQKISYRVYENYETSELELESLKAKGLQERDIIRDKKGRILIPKDVFLKYGKPNFSYETKYISSGNYEFSLPNYKKSLIEDGGRTLFPNTKAESFKETKVEEKE
ncbi:hypothetical protein J2Z62_000210 [Mycoplasmoides fastidiosum]|uniref:Uncharacterized protein n=1 Tax=Mycoplasmoides fastidiosum TaxID=92758 RepID=A0ABU0LYI8_9BACT|nr:hypothetical protein [Mycoplasmoides fastidiosum]MDQ0513772.1 hypothetical protein [Mycoplasmoides fastidiosum]UUD37810.1 hypothetical protein NPA10_00210 [Mycoplasmoides fastidiosum]